MTLAIAQPKYQIPDPIKHLPGGTLPGVDPLRPINDALRGHISNPIGGVTHAVGSTASFLETLGNPHTWVRVGEVLVGTVLLIVGIDHMFGTNITGKAAKVTALPFK